MADGQGQDGEPTAPGRYRRPIWLGVLAAALTFIAVFGTWRTQVTTQENRNAATSPGDLFEREQSEGTSLTAVGRVSGLPAPCTGWVLATGGGDDVPAHAVTTAGCVGLSDPSKIVTDRPVRDAVLTVNTFARPTGADDASAVPVPIERIVWASVRGTNLAVLELGATVGELVGRGVRAIDVVPTPEPGAELLVAGVPVAGVPENRRFLRGSRCQLGGSAGLLSESLFWPEVWAMDCPGILEGSHGSAVVNQAGQALAMVSATTIGAPDGPDCTDARPCEVTSGGESVRENTSYLVAVEALAGCFPDGALQLGVGCGLEEPAEVVPAVASSHIGRPGSRIEVALRGESPTPAPMVTQGPLGELDCRVLAGWGESAEPRPAASTRAVGQGWAYPVTLPAQEGRTLVCVGSAMHPTQIVLTVDGTAPDPDSIELTQTVVASGVQVQPVADPPDLVAFRWLITPPGFADCGAAEGYVEYRGSPETIQAADLPATVCVIGVDEAGNASEPAAIKVT